MGPHVSREAFSDDQEHNVCLKFPAFWNSDALLMQIRLSSEGGAVPGGVFVSVCLALKVPVCGSRSVQCVQRSCCVCLNS